MDVLSNSLGIPCSYGNIHRGEEVESPLILYTVCMHIQSMLWTAYLYIY